MSFIASAFALFVLIVGTNLPSPLYAAYAHRFGFSPLLLTMIFATYAAALVPALLLAGAAADAWGYRRMLIPGLLFALIGTLVFAFADSTGWLFLARALQGAAVGISSGALTAALTRTQPVGNDQLAPLIASLATAAGGGLGPVIAGVCATWLPAPTMTCYLIEVVALIAAVAGLLTLPAALGRTGAVWKIRLPQLPDANRQVFLRACTTSFIAWAVTAVFLSILPAYIHTLTGNHNLALAGAASGLILLVAAATQSAAARLSASTLQRAGLLIMAVGLVVLLTAGASRLLPLVIVSAVIAGIGQGSAFMGALRQANRVAPKNAHAAVISTFYIATYLGVGIPIIGVGLVATVTGISTAVDIFAIAAILASITAATVRSRTREHSTSVHR